MIGEGVHICRSLVGSKLEAGIKIREIVIINHDPDVWGSLLQGLLFGFLDCY